MVCLGNKGETRNVRDLVGKDWDISEIKKNARGKHKIAVPLCERLRRLLPSKAGKSPRPKTLCILDSSSIELVF